MWHPVCRCPALLRRLCPAGSSWCVSSAVSLHPWLTPPACGEAPCLTTALAEQLLCQDRYARTLTCAEASLQHRARGPHVPQSATIGAAERLGAYAPTPQAQKQPMAITPSALSWFFPGLLYRTIRLLASNPSGPPRVSGGLWHMGDRPWSAP